MEMLSFRRLTAHRSLLVYCVATSCGLALLLAQAFIAQTAPKSTPAPQDYDLIEIIVTGAGTWIRGAASTSTENSRCGLGGCDES